MTGIRPRSRPPRVVYWNNQPAPYVVSRFNAIMQRGTIDFEAWFDVEREPDRDWSVDASDWLFPARYIPLRRWAKWDSENPVGGVTGFPPRPVGATVAPRSFHRFRGNPRPSRSRANRLSHPSHLPSLDRKDPVGRALQAFRLPRGRWSEGPGRRRRGLCAFVWPTGRADVARNAVDRPGSVPERIGLLGLVPPAASARPRALRHRVHLCRAPLERQRSQPSD